ncbi:ABC transporter G family member 14, partial [Cucurbita argyrosperma subsp. argyrosperma]
GENIEEEQKGVKEALISAYEKNISSTLKAELCSLDANSFTNYAKDASKRERRCTEEWCTSWWYQFRSLALLFLVDSFGGTLHPLTLKIALGLAFGAILMDVKQATTLASVTTLVFLIAGGYYIQQIPPFILWMKYLSYSYYCYKLLLGVQYQNDDVYECRNGELCRVADFPAVKSVGLDGLWVCVCIMALMLVGYRLIAYLALHRVRLR